MKKTLWTLTSAAALLCVAAMATAEAPVATGETAWLRGKPVATYTCAGKTVIPVSALGEYGFDVENGDALKITVNDAEITAEANPDSVDLKGLRMLRRAGFNRLSLGMQSADPGELAAVHRPHV